MKTIFKLTALLFVFAICLNVSVAQDSNPYSKEYEQQKLNSVYVPQQNESKAPFNQENSILFLSNCPPQDRPTCLKEPFDASDPSWIQAMPPNDDGSSGLIALPFTFNLYGLNFTSLFINNNGNLTFSGPLSTFTPTAFPSITFGAIVAPFFADVDTRPAASGLVYYKMYPNRMVVTWDSVGYFGNHVDKRNTFQVIISDGTDPFLGLGNNVCFSYGDMAWTTGDASGGSGGFGGAAATVGVNKGDGVTYATLGRFDRPGSSYWGPLSDTNGVSYLDCQNYCLNSSNSSNICPVAQNFPPSPVVLPCASGVHYTATYSFSSPEIGQTVTIGYTSTPPLPPDFNINIVNQGTANASFELDFLPKFYNMGTYQICFYGIDDYTAPCTTTVCVVYVNDCPLPVELSSFTSTINDRDVTLNWATATEENNARFEIERSASTNNWINVGSVAGNGNSSVPHSYTFTDRGLISGSYSYRLKQVDFNGNYQYYDLSNEVVIGTPEDFSLMQNYPNPFNPSTKINYSMPVDGKVRLAIYDMAGKEVQSLVNGVQTAGYYSVKFDGSKLSSGVYYYRLEVTGSKNFIDTRKMLLVK
ncbi:MAG: T9SS type A sorting domain-containing protein [Ignavibacteria bacterium]|nr:T9SS type A sorting domain-containing protein [Ignavibacteria bacterium]